MASDLKVKIGKETFANPVWVASGTFACGKEFEELLDLKRVGAIVTKTVTLKARQGNRPPRVVETASGMLNSIGLENKGADAFKKEQHGFLKKCGTKFIVSLSGPDADDFEKCAEELAEYAPYGVEVNLSCPNVAHTGTGGGLIAQDPVMTGEIIRGVRKKTGAPLIAKLTPNVTDIASIAKAAEAAGADAVAVANTYSGMAVDARTMKPLLGNVTGGLSGPAIKPLAMKAVWDVYNNINIPVIGIGGIMTGIDVAEFMLCGATAVEVGTSNLIDPCSHNRILDEFGEYLEKKNITKVKDLIGALKT